MSLIGADLVATPSGGRRKAGAGKNRDETSQKQRGASLILLMMGAFITAMALA